MGLKEKVSVLVVSNDPNDIKEIIKALKKYFPKIYLSKKNEKLVPRIKNTSPKLLFSIIYQ